MTNKIAIVLGLLIACAIALNVWQGWDLHIFLGRKLAQLIEYLAFWR